MTITKIKHTLQPIVILIMIIGLSACGAGQVQSETSPPTGSTPLDRWLEGTLLPYLLEQLGEHPRFKGQPVLLVGMRGERVLSGVDDLTKEIREKIIDALLKQPGIDLVWQSSPSQHQVAPRPGGVACSNYRKVQYYIGIDCGLTHLARELSVKVRAMNLAENKWVSGFGRSWEGNPTAAQRAALLREQPDEYLRGQRPLPFSEDQPDLLAAYLARNISCLLSQAESEDLVIYIARPAAGTPAFIGTTIGLVGKYLAQMREFEVTDDPDHANVNLMVEVHAIHQGLHQIWLSAQYRRNKNYLPGAETEAYVWIGGHDPARLAGSRVERPDAPLPVVQRISASSEIIASFDLLTPRYQGPCAAGAHQRWDLRRVEPYDRLPTGSCLAMEVSVATPAYVFLVGQDAEGELTQMFPSSCAGFKDKDTLVYPGRRFQFPSLVTPETRILELAGSPGKESVYAIAITRPDLADGFASRLNSIQDLCRPGQKFSETIRPGVSRNAEARIHQWQNHLSRLSADNPGWVQWQEISFWHEPK